MRHAQIAWRWTRFHQGCLSRWGLSRTVGAGAGGGNPVIFLVLLLPAALAIRVLYLSLPGPYGDEMSFVLPAYEMRWHVPFSNAITAYVFGQQLPVMFNPYTGAIPIYIQMIVARLPEVGWFAYRLPDIIYALLAIVATYLFAADAFGVAAARISAVLLAFMPSFVFYSRVGEPWLFLRVVVSSVLLFSIFRWWRTGRWGYWYIAAWTVGIGLSTRLETLWWLLALPLTISLAHGRAWRTVLGRVKAAWWHVAGGTAVVLLGAGPFLFYNYSAPEHRDTLSFIRANLWTTLYGEHNAAILHHIHTRIQHLLAILGGSDGEAFGVLGFSYPNLVHVVAFLVGFGALGAVAVRARRRGAPVPMVEGLLVTFAFLFVMSLFTVSVFRPYHLLMLFPLPALIIARALLLVRRPWLIGVLAMTLAVTDLAADGQYYRALVRTQGVGLFSSGILALVEQFRRDGVRSVLACDWGLLPQIAYLSRGQITGREVFGGEMGYDRIPPSFYRAVADSLHNPDNIYLFHAQRYEQYPRREMFLAYLDARALPYQEHVIFDRNGALYYYYRVLAERPMERLAGGARTETRTPTAPSTALPGTAATRGRTGSARVGAPKTNASPMSDATTSVPAAVEKQQDRRR
jgi:4-amino-4-deoxy-L-arabinose transferase-like glycosyltransferase